MDVLRKVKRGDTKVDKVKDSSHPEKRDGKRPQVHDEVPPVYLSAQAPGEVY